MDTEQLAVSPPPAAPAPMPMNSSATISKLAVALAAAQGKFPTIPRDRTVRVTMKSGGTYTFAYAPLETILEKVRPPLAENKLALLQAIVLTPDGEVLRTTLLHESGEWIACDTPIFIGTSGDNKSQAYASGVTYSRRYGVTLLLCVAADEDDDGNGGEQGGSRPDYDRQRQPQRGKPNRGRSGPPPEGAAEAEPERTKHVEGSPWGDGLTASQVSLLTAKSKAAGYTNEAAILERFGIITPETCNQVLQSLRTISNS